MDVTHALDGSTQTVELLDEIVAVDLVLERDSDHGHLPREELRVGERAGVHPAVTLGLSALAIGLAVLRQQDQGRRVRGLGREREVEQDERIRVPAQRYRGDIEDDPNDDEAGLKCELTTRTEKTSEALARLANTSGL
jgi:hypothetical protein